jgi:SAM-dependent methyltransferase
LREEVGLAEDALAEETALSRLGLLGTDAVGYWQFHQRRFAWTQQRVAPLLQPGTRVLELAAGLMFSALAMRDAGAHVIVGEMPFTHEYWPQLKPAVQRAGIETIDYAQLANPIELRQIEESSIDLMLFCEAIEHITFNPVAMWREVYRVLKPGGRIIVTTPSYYGWKGRAWDLRRLRLGMGGGIHVDEILLSEETSPHWKEFSGDELRRYFSMLSADFAPAAIEYVDVYDAPETFISKTLKQWLPALRQMICCEVQLPHKRVGIQAKPSWAAVTPGYETVVERKLNFPEWRSPAFTPVGISGFCDAEPWGRWTNGDVARIDFAQPLPKQFVLELQVDHVYADNSAKPTRIVIADAVIADAVIADAVVECLFNRSGQTYEIPVTTNGQATAIEIHLPAAQSPAERDGNVNGDRRKLGIGISAIRVREL